MSCNLTSSSIHIGPITHTKKCWKPQHHRFLNRTKVKILLQWFPTAWRAHFWCPSDHHSLTSNLLGQCLTSWCDPWRPECSYNLCQVMLGSTCQGWTSGRRPRPSRLLTSAGRGLSDLSPCHPLSICACPPLNPSSRLSWPDSNSFIVLLIFIDILYVIFSSRHIFTLPTSAFCTYGILSMFRLQNCLQCHSFIQILNQWMKEHASACNHVRYPWGSILE